MLVMFSKNDLRKDLENLQIAPSDTLLIHSSMKSIGEVDGGADAVLDMLMDYFKESGLLLFPTLSYRSVNAKNTCFDVANTPACTGILPELFRKKPGVVRSLHPTHSLAAFGSDAENFVAGHEKANTPAPVGSPWWKILQKKGKIMFIGTGINCNTFIHGVEEWLPVPGMLTDSRQELVIIDENAVRIKRPMRRHLGGHSKWYHLMASPFRENNALREGVFGNAKVHILDARAAGDLVYQILKRTPLFFTDEYQLSKA